MSKNALQAVLDKAAQEPGPAPTAPAKAVPAKPARAAAPRPRASMATSRSANDPEASGRFHRPSREDKKLIAGHFDPKVAKQLKLLAVEDDTTVQALLEEALDLLFAKKGRARITDLLRVST